MAAITAQQVLEVVTQLLQQQERTNLGQQARLEALIENTTKANLLQRKDDNTSHLVSRITQFVYSPEDGLTLQTE